MGMIYVVGIGPGSRNNMTAEAIAAMDQADVLCGYTVYVDLVRDMYPGKETYTTSMMQELDRCRWAVEQAEKGRTVALLCSGDAGVYGMAGPLLEQAAGKNVGIEVVPGVTAALAGAALLGAPLTHDFCVISLSDLLTPWELIEKRVAAAGMADFVICLYNPMSKKRRTQLCRACRILLEERSADTVCGYVKNIDREGQEITLTTLGELEHTEVDMFTTVFIGNSQTKILDGRMVTPRGYIEGPRN